MIEWASIRSLLGVLFLGNLGALLSLKVLGRRNLTAVRTFFTRVPKRPLTTFFLAARALEAAGVLATFFSGLTFLMVLGSFLATGFLALGAASALAAFSAFGFSPAGAFFFPSLPGMMDLFSKVVFFLKKVEKPRKFLTKCLNK